VRTLLRVKRGRLIVEAYVGHRFGLGLVCGWDGLCQVSVYIGPFELWVAW